MIVGNGHFRPGQLQTQLGNIATTLTTNPSFIKKVIDNHYHSYYNYDIKIMLGTLKSWLTTSLIQKLKIKQYKYQH